MKFNKGDCYSRPLRCIRNESFLEVSSKFYICDRTLFVLDSQSLGAPMPEGILVSLLFKIAPSLLTTAAKAGVQSVLKQSSVTKAIEATCVIYPELEPLRHTLSTWCESKRFGEILEQIKAGNPLEAGVRQSYLPIQQL